MTIIPLLMHNIDTNENIEKVHPFTKAEQMIHQNNKTMFTTGNNFN